MIKNSNDKNRRNRNRIKDGKQKPSRPAFPSNGNLNKKPKTDDITSDATGRRESASNNNNNIESPHISAINKSRPSSRATSSDNRRSKK